MLSINDLRSNTKILLNDEPYVVVTFQHSKMGRGGAVVRTTLKHLVNGSMLNKTFQGADKIEEANIDSSKAQYLYRDNDSLFFMDNESYEQFELPLETVSEDTALLMPEGLEVDVLLFNDNPVNISLPPAVIHKITDAEIGAKGNTASGNAGKNAVTETGLSIQVPQFVEAGDSIKINTETRAYVERA